MYTQHGGSSYKMTVDAPMPGIIPYSNLTGPLSQYTKYSHWFCAETMVSTANLTKWEGASVTAYCQAAGNKYVWSFSFLLAFIVLVAQLLVALMMYGLWLCFCRQAGLHDEISELKDAVTMVTQAQQQHGDNLASWNAPTLRRRVLKGTHGVSLARGDAKANEAVSADG